MPPKEETAAKRKQEIYQAALTCFLRKGYHRATMDDIVTESGLSKGTLYWYFKSKKDLFLSLFQMFMGEIGENWTAIADDPEMRATEKVKATIDLFRLELEQIGPYFGIMMEAWALTRQDEDVESLMQGMYEPYMNIMTRILDEGVSNGEFQVADAEATALVIITLYDGMTLAAGLNMTDFDYNRMMDAAEVLVKRGLGIDGSHVNE
jgi:AcrR family transcriptional regulator